jgi:hypothetical protein
MFGNDVWCQVMRSIAETENRSGVATIGHADIREFYARQYIRQELPRSRSAGRAA